MHHLFSVMDSPCLLMEAGSIHGTGLGEHAWVFCGTIQYPLVAAGGGGGASNGDGQLGGHALGNPGRAAPPNRMRANQPLLSKWCPARGGGSPKEALSGIGGGSVMPNARRRSPGAMGSGSSQTTSAIRQMQSGLQNSPAADNFPQHGPEKHIHQN